MTVSTRERQKAIHDFIWSCTAPVVIAGDERTWVQGTGTFFRLGGSPYFITARHVLQEVDFNRIGVPVAPGLIVPVREHDGRYVSLVDSDLWTFRKAVIRVPSEEEHDVVALALRDEEAVAKFEERWRFLSADHLLGMDREVGEFLVSGYLNHAVEYGNGTRVFGRFTLRTHRVDAPSEGVALENPVNPDTDLFLAYARYIDYVDLEDGSGEKAETPDLHGISGCAIWADLGTGVPDGVWAADRQVRFAAIESSFVHTKFVRGRRLNVLEALFKNFDEAAWREIRCALRGE